jgi:hypothetical protein
MARACPACARPNGDRAAKCLYCSEPLETLSEIDAASPVETQLEIATPSVEDRHLVILIPGRAPDDEAVESLADAAEMSLYEARLSLAATRPRVFRRIEEFFARALSEQLSAARIPHYVVSEISVRALPVSRAHAVKLEAGHVDVGVDGLNVAVPYQDIQLLVRGEIAREHHDDKKLTTTRGANRSLSPGLLLHLYSREASVAIEIDPEGIAWPQLGGATSPSALLNLENFIDVIEERARGVTVDRGFDLEPPVFSRASGDGQDFAQILSSRGAPRGALYDNQDQFRDYARWRYRLERHLRKTSRPG